MPFMLYSPTSPEMWVLDASATAVPALLCHSQVSGLSILAHRARVSTTGSQEKQAYSYNLPIGGSNTCQGVNVLLPGVQYPTRATHSTAR